MVRAPGPRGVGERIAAGDDRRAALHAALDGRGVIPAVPGKAFPSRLHDERVAAMLGLWLGIAFLTCFATGLYSHFAQHPLDLGFLSMPASPGWVGVIAELGREAGIPTPAIRCLVALIHAIEDGRKPMAFASFSELIAVCQGAPASTA